MNKKTYDLMKVASLAMVAALLPMLTGCGSGPGYGRTSVQADVIYDNDDYVYYPDYEVYYSRARHHYVYRDGRSWVARPAPAGVSAEILLASPSVQVDFHDSPAHHHTNIIKTYPKHWKPAAEPRREIRKDHRDDERRDEHKDRDHDRDDHRKSDRKDDDKR